jgi:hypothetical protein
MTVFVQGWGKGIYTDKNGAGNFVAVGGIEPAISI